MRRLRGGGLGALAERPYRLLFAATLITSLGDRVATVALPFAVLGFASVTELGVVVAVRQIAAAAVLVLGGVLSDRVRRSQVLMGASLCQGVAQGGAAATVLLGHPSLAAFLAFGLLWGLGDGLVVPAEAGLVPETVGPALLQQANALQGLSRSTVGVVGPALGGVLVVAVGAGWGLAVDGASFAVCAVLLARIRLAQDAVVVTGRFVRELRAGWDEFRSLGWLWPTSVMFGLSNLFLMFWFVVGPLVAKQRLGGAGAWAVILAAGGIGAVLGGLGAIGHRPRRPLMASILWALAVVVEFAALALGAGTPIVAAAATAAGAGSALHVALWYTVLQTEVPAQAQSRVVSFDTLGSIVLTPIGAAVAGPAAGLIGADGALWAAAGAITACYLTMIALPSVRAIRRVADH